MGAYRVRIHGCLLRAKLWYLVLIKVTKKKKANRVDILITWGVNCARELGKKKKRFAYGLCLSVKGDKCAETNSGEF